MLEPSYVGGAGVRSAVLYKHTHRKDADTRSPVLFDEWGRRGDQGAYVCVRVFVFVHDLHMHAKRGMNSFLFSGSPKH